MTQQNSGGSTLPARREAPASYLSPAATAAMARGDRAGLVAALGELVQEGDRLTLADRLAEIALELRRESVAVIGNHEAFVRHNSEGSLVQVVRPVALSLHDKSLYQIPKRGKVNGQWQTLKSYTADLTFQGLQRLNAVAGCAVGQPATVMVDGEPKTNPYVQRAKQPNSTRPGDIERVVIAVVVVGPTPATGNIVAVSYTLDYDPSKDLQHMLASVAKEAGEGKDSQCYLTTEDEQLQAGWHFVPIHGGVGWAFNLRTKAVRQVYSDFIGLCQNAVKKAQTVARRNAMRQHPALATASVEIDDNGRARIAVIGWAQSQDYQATWMQTLDRLSKGMDLPEVEHVQHVEHVYDPEEEPEAVYEEPTPEDADREERNRLIQYIDDGMLNLSPSQAAGFNYDPAGDLEHLAAAKSRLDALLDGGDA